MENNTFKKRVYEVIEVSSIGDTLARVAEISGVPIPEEELVESPALSAN